MAEFDAAAAEKAGYSPSEIADYLGKQSNFDVGGARKSGYSDAEIIGFLSKPPAAKAEAPYSLARAFKYAHGGEMASDMGNAIANSPELGQLALGSRHLAKGLLSPVMMGMDLPSMLRNQIMGTKYSTPSQALDEAMTAAGAPTPQTPREHMVAALNEGGGAAASFAAMPSAPAVPASLLTSLRSGVIGAGASEYAREKGYPWWAQMAAGVAAPAAFDVGKLAAKGVWQTMLPPSAGGMSPYTQGGREAAAGNVLARTATTPGATADRLAQGVETAPGIATRTAEVGGDVGLARLDKLLQTTRPGYAADVLNQEGANNRTLREMLDQAASDQAARAGDKVATATTTARNAALAAANANVPEEVGGVLKLIANLRDSKLAISDKNVRPALDEVERQLYDSKGKLITDPDRLDAVRQYVSKMIAGNFDEPGKQYSKANVALHQILERVKGTVDTALTEAPGLESQSYTQSLRATQSALAPVNQRDVMQQLLEKASSKADILPGGASATGGENYRLVLSKLSSALANERMASKAERVLTDEQVSTVSQVVAELERGAKLTSMQKNRLGSDTMQNLSSAALFGRILGIDLPPSVVDKAPDYIRKTLGWIANMGGGPQEKITALVEQAMHDPKLAAELLKKAPAANLETIGEALGRKGREYSVSGARATKPPE